MNFMYFVWFLLPGSLLLISLWTVSQRSLKDKRTYYSKFYFKQGMFCLFCFIVCLLIDIYVFGGIVEALDIVFQFLNPIAVDIFEWLLYPIVLLVISAVQPYVIKAQKPKDVRGNKRR